MQSLINFFFLIFLNTKQGQSVKQVIQQNRKYSEVSLINTLLCSNYENNKNRTEIIALRSRKDRTRCPLRCNTKTINKYKTITNLR